MESSAQLRLPYILGPSILYLKAKRRNDTLVAPVIVTLHAYSPNVSVARLDALAQLYSAPRIFANPVEYRQTEVNR